MKLMRQFAIIAMTLLCCVGHAQTSNSHVHFEMATSYGLESKNVTPIDFSFNAQYDIIPIIYAFASVDRNLALYDADAENCYYEGELLGGGIGIHLWGNNKDKHVLDARLKVLTSIGNSDWKQTSYYTCLAWYMKNLEFSPVVEIGFRHIDSKTSYLNDYRSVFLSIGLRY